MALWRCFQKSGGIQRWVVRSFREERDIDLKEDLAVGVYAKPEWGRGQLSQSGDVL
jgi:hypothetical protein